MAIVIAAGLGTLMVEFVIYACIVVGSRMDEQLQDLQQQLTDIETANAGALREYRIWEHEIEKIEPYLR